jgi:ketosteroid isomerase-like protein
MNNIQNDNIKIVRTMLDNGLAGRWDVVKPYVSDNLVLRVPKGLPFGGDQHGWEGYMQALKNLSEFFTDIKIGKTDLAPCGDKVIVISSLAGRIAKNGNPVSFPLTEIWEVKNGQVVDILAFFYDTKAICDAAS